jgi:hypothetical protein
MVLHMNVSKYKYLRRAPINKDETHNAVWRRMLVIFTPRNCRHFVCFPLETQNHIVESVNQNVLAWVLWQEWMVQNIH